MTMPPAQPGRTPIGTWRANALIVGLAVLSLVLSSLPLVGRILLPFEFFTTFIHEGGHALAAWLVGGEVGRIVLNPDTSGYTMTRISGGRLAQGFVSSAGYLGAALFGGLLIVASAYRRLARMLLFALGLVFLIVLALYVRDLFTMIVCAGFAVALIMVAVKTGDLFNFYALNFLAVQAALNSIRDVITLVRLSLGAPKSEYSLPHSDADAVAQLFWLPAVFWSVLWVAFSVLVLYFAMKKSAAIRARTTVP